MTEITVALMQLSAHGNDQDVNRAKGEVFCRRAQQMGADIALFPEMWNIGHTFEPAGQQSVGDVWRGPEFWLSASDPYSSEAREAVRRWQSQAMANYPEPRLGHSVAYDPIAFTTTVDGQVRDTLIVEAGEQEDIFPASFDLAAIRDWRVRAGWGSPFRRPSCYGLLTSHEVRAPFVRVSAKGELYDDTVGRTRSALGDVGSGTPS